jgi:hypothetical protein
VGVGFGHAEAYVILHPHWVCSMQYPCLGWHLAADSEVEWTKGHDKLGVGVTQDSNKVLWYRFPMGGQSPSKQGGEGGQRQAR